MRVAVIGAGIAGLTCAFNLQQAGVAVQVFERQPRVGGRMGTRVRDGLAFDLGANFLIRSYSTICELAARLGIRLNNLSPVRHSVLRDGTTFPMNYTAPRDLRTLGGLNWQARARLAWLALKARFRPRPLDFFDLSKVPARYNCEDAYSYAARKVGSDFANYIVDGFNSCMMFSRARDMSAATFAALFGMMAGTNRDFTVQHAEGEMQAIPSALAERLTVHTSTPVASLEPTRQGWRVHSRLGEMEFDRVVLASTAGAGRRLLKEPGEHLELLRLTQYASTINVSFRVPKGTLGDVHCFYVPFLENPVIAEFTNEALKEIECEGDSLVNVGLHEKAARALLHSSDETIFHSVRQQLLSLHPGLAAVAAQVRPHDLQRWPEAIPKYSGRHVERVKHFLEHGQGRQGLYLCGDYLNAPWTEGASRTGQRVAELLIDGRFRVEAENSTL
ncbi:MAG: FAD-dependent oxidoreductase [Candidatus Eremiobacteraeota bacterium]|nr:FAD-dependent oxidoreductase [Candidatus Eremiobacteraeota bacterium]MCW5872798.1 FAD-dependent oxidoreductase [Candidatus Eremiobacteraeota bacterium]